MMIKIRFLTLLVFLWALAGCVTPPFVSKGTDRDLTPADVLEGQVNSGTDSRVVQKVLWGGVVIGASNEVDSTTVEILSYPLDYLQRPEASGRSTGRFLAVIDSYLEAADFPAGSRVTAIGTLSGIEDGQIGDANYRYAVVRLASATDLHRWRASDYYNSSPVSFGIGISISR